jgi:hypothetical protein
MLHALRVYYIATKSLSVDLTLWTTAVGILRSSSKRMRQLCEENISSLSFTYMQVSSGTMLCLHVTCMKCCPKICELDPCSIEYVIPSCKRRSALDEWPNKVVGAMDQYHPTSQYLLTCLFSRHTSRLISRMLPPYMCACLCEMIPNLPKSGVGCRIRT